MNTTRLKQARRIFGAYDCSRGERRAYMRQWVQQLRNLGSRWLLAQ